MNRTSTTIDMPTLIWAMVITAILASFAGAALGVVVLRQRPELVASLRGPAGPRGPIGPAGRDGASGPAGTVGGQGESAAGSAEDAAMHVVCNELHIAAGFTSDPDVDANGIEAARARYAELGCSDY